MRIRCKNCRKRISIDRAFAGGVCRCPYCKTINFVPGGVGERVGARPDVPAAMSPAPPPDERRGDEGHVPTADPVKVQGIVSIILLAALLGMIVGGVALVIHTLKSRPEGTPATKPAPPETQDIIPPERPKPFSATDVPNVGGGSADPAKPQAGTTKSKKEKGKGKTNDRYCREDQRYAEGDRRRP